MFGLEIGELLSILLFFGAIGAVLLGYPVAFALGGTAFLVGLLGISLDVFGMGTFMALPSRVFGIMNNQILVAILLFVFMGVTLERSRVAEDMLESIGQAFSALRGGLGYGVLVVGALLAASTGIVGATVVTMGLLSLPAMLRSGYDPRLSSGLICATGTLGQILPPSILLIILGDQLSNAYMRAMRAEGQFGFDPLTVIDLFAGALLPGLMMVGLYAVYLTVIALRAPERCPSVQDQGVAIIPLYRVLLSVMPAIILIVLVLGSILTGLATPTEAGGVGALGALIIAAVKRRLSFQVSREIMLNSLTITSMIFLIFIGASVFSFVFRSLGGEAMVQELLTALPGGVTGALVFVLATMFIMGFFLDYAEIVLIVIPIVGPVILAMGVDPIWFGIMVGVCLQTSFLTPPFGFALFYLRGVAPKEITTVQLYRGVAPFIALQLLALAILGMFPQLATWLPKVLF